MFTVLCVKGRISASPMANMMSDGIPFIALGRYTTTQLRSRLPSIRPRPSCKKGILYVHRPLQFSPSLGTAQRSMREASSQCYDGWPQHVPLSHLFSLPGLVPPPGLLRYEIWNDFLKWKWLEWFQSIWHETWLDTHQFEHKDWPPTVNGNFAITLGNSLAALSASFPNRLYENSQASWNLTSNVASKQQRIASL